MNALAGTGRLVRLGLRRDRVVLPAWLVALGGLVAASVASVGGLYTTAEQREAAAAFMAGNRLSRAFDGPASGSSLGALTMVETFAVLAILAALMTIQTIARHTRQDEETGRAELVGSAVVGHHARLTAALLLALGVNAVLAATTTVVLLAQGLPVQGAVISGAALGAVGMTFAATAAVTVQLAASQRGATGLAATVLGAAFLLRAVGDAAGQVTPRGDTVVSAWPSWLSPIGWGQQARPFSDNNWEVFGLFGGLTLALVVVAFALTSHRDLGAGLLATRAGPPTAGNGLGSPLGLVWRLQRGAVVGWTVALVVLGAAFGSLGDGVDEIAGLSDELAAVLEQLAADGTLLDAFFAFIMGFLGVAAAGFTIQSLLRARAEEASGRLEAILAAAVGRRRWLAASCALTVACTSAILLLTGVAAGVSYGLVTGDLATGLASFTAAAAVQIPAVLVLGGLVVATVGVAPGLAVAVGWTSLAVSLVVGQFGELLSLPQGVMNLSPFTHVPAVPAESFAATPVIALAAVAVALAGAGAEAFRRRDLAL